MGKFDYDRSASVNLSAFHRLASGSAEGFGAGKAGRGASKGPTRHTIFNQVQVSGGSQRRASSGEPRLAGLYGAVDDLRASAETLGRLSESSREVLEANVGASAASVKEVEAAAKLAGDLGRRIVEDDLAATEAQADNLTPDVVERLLRS
jgi:hypothetical protein